MTKMNLMTWMNEMNYTILHATKTDSIKKRITVNVTIVIVTLVK